MRTVHLGILTTLATLPGVGACVLPDELSRIQKDMADVQQRLTRIERTQAEAELRIEELAAAEEEQGQTVTRRELAELDLRLDEVARQAAVAAERVNDVDQRLDRYSQDLAQVQDSARRGVPPSFPPRTPPGGSGPVEGTAAPAAAAQTSPDPEALYNTAYADFSKGNYALAISGFDEYHERFASSALADNALYWIGECHFSQGAYGPAVEAFDRLLERYPDSDKAAAANLKKALAFQEQNQIQQAIIQYRYVTTAFANTDEARLARDKLVGLGASPN